MINIKVYKTLTSAKFEWVLIVIASSVLKNNQSSLKILLCLQKCGYTLWYLHTGWIWQGHAMAVAWTLTYKKYWGQYNTVHSLFWSILDSWYHRLYAYIKHTNKQKYHTQISDKHPPLRRRETPLFGLLPLINPFILTTSSSHSLDLALVQTIFIFGLIFYKNV